MCLSCGYMRKLRHLSLCEPYLAICMNNTSVYMDPSLRISFFLTNKKSLFFFFFTNKIVFFWLTKKILQEKNVGNQIQILYILQLTFNQQYVTSIVLMMLAMGTVLRLLRWKMLPSLKGLKVGSAHLVKTPTSLWSGQQQCLTEAEAVQWQ